MPATSILLESLRATIANAVRAPYYRKRFPKELRALKRMEDFERLPLLDKATAIAQQKNLVVGPAPAGFGVVSSGTTRREVDQPPLNVLHSPEEARAIFAGLPDELGQEDPYPGWTVVSIAVTHGLPDGPPGPNEIFLPWLYDRNALYMLEGMLEKPQPDGRRVTAMRISVGALKTFTAWLLERGKDPSSFGVRLIGTNSFRLSPFWRQLIENAFGAQVFDNYSLSELVTPATECGACGWLHFGWPPVHFEVLDLHSAAPLPKGAGRLVMTGLYPYVQKMPLVRYDTGDVVELGPRCTLARARGLRFLGRVRRGLVVRNGDRAAYVLAPTIVQDVLEALPETERSSHPLTILGVVRSRDVGLPRWQVSLEPGAPPVAHLQAEVRFDPHIYTEQAQYLGRGIHAELLRLDGSLRRLVRAGRVRLRVSLASPQTLSPPPDKYD